VVDNSELKLTTSKDLLLNIFRLNKSFFFFRNLNYVRLLINTIRVVCLLDYTVAQLSTLGRNVYKIRKLTGNAIWTCLSLSHFAFFYHFGPRIVFFKNREIFRFIAKSPKYPEMDATLVSIGDNRKIRISFNLLNYIVGIIVIIE